MTLKRLFLAIVFLIFFTSSCYGENYVRKNYEANLEKNEFISEQVLRSESSFPVREIIEAFISSVIFVIEIFAFYIITQEEFEIGTIKKKIKFRKQMPRGNLAY